MLDLPKSRQSRNWKRPEEALQFTATTIVSSLARPTTWLRRKNKHSIWPAEATDSNENFIQGQDELSDRRPSSANEWKINFWRCEQMLQSSLASFAYVASSVRRGGSDATSHRFFGYVSAPAQGCCIPIAEKKLFVHGTTMFACRDTWNCSTITKQGQ